MLRIPLAPRKPISGVPEIGPRNAEVGKTRLPTNRHAPGVEHWREQPPACTITQTLHLERGETVASGVDRVFELFAELDVSTPPDEAFTIQLRERNDALRYEKHRCAAPRDPMTPAQLVARPRGPYGERR